MWLISDYDGTLRNGADNSVDAQDLLFVNNFIRQKNNRFVIATGRGFFQMEKMMEKIGLTPDYYITNAGAYILDNEGKVIYKNLINQETLDKLLDYLKTITLENVIYADEHGEYYLFVHNEVYQKRDDRFGARPLLNIGFDDLRNKEVACFKIVDERDVLEKLVSELKELFQDSISIVVNTDSNLVEIHPKNSSKANAIKHLQEILNINDDEIIVAGDDDNDVMMLDNYEMSFCIRQPYNERIQNHGTHLINSLWEIEFYLKK